MYEVVLVDDHGTDRSMELVAELRRTHPRGQIIRVIRPEHNVGQARGREMALQAAAGRCFFMMDDDDLLLPDTLSRLYALQQKYDADLAEGSCSWGMEPGQSTRFEEAVLTDSRSVQTYNYRWSHWCCIWNILYRTDFLRQCRFTLDGCSMLGMEDRFLRTQVINKAVRAVYTSDVTYLYRWSASSVSTPLMYNGQWRAIMDDGLRFMEDFMRPLVWPAPEGRGKAVEVICQGQKLRQAGWTAIALCGRMMCARSGRIDDECRSYLKRMLVFPIPGRFLRVVRRLLRLDTYRMKGLVLYSLYCLPWRLQARFAYRYGLRMYAGVTGSDGNKPDWEVRMLAKYRR